MDWVAVVQQLDRDLLAIEMVKNGLYRQEIEIRSISLFDKETGSPVSKEDFKDIGSAGMIVSQVGMEALIGLIANAIETFTIRLKRHLNVKWEPFTKPKNHVRYADRARQFRALNNIFKHQEGYVKSATSEHAKFLVATGYCENETYLKSLTADRIVPNFELALYETFTHLFEICVEASGLPNDLHEKSGVALIDALRDRAIYPIIRQSIAGKKFDHLLGSTR
jgi:hypothetical protein